MNSLIRNIRTTMRHGQLKDLRQTLNQENTSFLEVYKPEIEHVVPKKGGYQKLPLYEEELFQVYYIKWWNNAVSGIHAHPKEKCFFKILEGNLQEYVYPPYTDGSNLFIKHSYSAGHVAYIDDSIGFHNIVNSNNHDAYSLHLYFKNDDMFANTYNHQHQ